MNNNSIVNFDRLPFSHDAEIAVLGSILQYPSAIDSAIYSGLAVKDFFSVTHQMIYKRMLEINEKGYKIDHQTLFEKLSAYGEIEAVGGFDYLYGLIQYSVAVANITQYIDIVLDKSKRRELIEHLKLSIIEAQNEAIHIGDVLSDVDKKVLEVTRSYRTSDFEDASTVIKEVRERIDLLRQGDGVSGVKTNYKILDNITNGLQRGDLIILAARPSMGKTAFALNLGLRIARQKENTVAVFSLEMPASALMSRMISADGAIDNTHMRNGQLDDEKYNRLIETMNRMQSYNIFIDETAGITMNEIFAKCRNLSKNRRLDLIVVDYLQLITTKGGRSENRTNEVSQISRELKMLAREMDCPVIALSQLSRSVESRTDKHPMLSDLRESGSIEQDADLVLFLYRDEYYNRNESKAENEPDITDVTIAKHRNGRTGQIKLAFEKQYSRFMEYRDD